MGDFTKRAQKVISVARGDEKKKPSPYDTKAVVNRIDYTEKKAYVRFYGGIDETPVDLTINCSRGDTVQVRVGGGRAWLTGNLTAPPTDDKAVRILNHTVNNLRNQLDKTKEELEEEIEEIEPGEGKLIERIATEYILSELNYLVDDEVVPYEPTPGEPMEWSEELPEWVPNPRTYFWKRTVIYYTDGTVDEQEPILDANAQISAEADYAISSENNYFWHDSTGAWVTEVEREDYIDDPTHGGYASRVTNAGILQTYNGNLLTSWTGSGVSFYDGSNPTASGSKTLAAFHSTGITFDTTTPFTIGNTTGQNPSYIRWVNTGTDWKLQINADTIQFGGNDVVTTDEVNLYSIKTSVESIIQNESTTTPTSIVVYFYEAEEAFTGRLRVLSSTDGTNWSTYSSSYGASSYTVPLSSSGKKYYKIMMYEDNDSSYTNLLASKTVPVIANGATGPQGPQGPAGTDVTSQYVTYISSAGGVVVRHAGNDNSYPYLMCNASGVYNYYSSTYFSKVDSTGLKVYSGDSTNPIAQFGSSINLGKTSGSDKSHVNISGNTIKYYDSSGTDYASNYVDSTSYYINSYGRSSGSQSLLTLNSTSSPYIRLYSKYGSIYSNFEMSYRDGISYTSTDYSHGGAELAVTYIGSTSNIASGVYIGIGTGGKNHGLYSLEQAEWLIYSGLDTEGANVFLPLAANSGTGGSAAYLNTNGKLYKSSSSKRYKHDISNISEPILDPKKLYNLRVVQFKFNEDVVHLGEYLYETFIPGFIAEEVAEAYPIAAVRDADNAYQIEDWDARLRLPPMLALIQDQKKMIDSLEERVSALEGGLQ